MSESRTAQTGGPLLLALRALGLGDFLCGVPAYRALARAFPEHRRIFAAPRVLHSLVPLLGGAFAEAVDVRPLGALPPTLGPVDVAVNLHGSGPQSHRILLDARPRRLIAFAHRDILQSAAGARYDPLEHEVSRWCRLLEHEGIVADRDDLALAIPAVDLPLAARNTAIVHPGAASIARRWPAERWAAVARELVARGNRVLVTGSRAERELTERVVALARRPEGDSRAAMGTPAGVSAAGPTSLLQLAALVAQARCVISGDTGIAHLAGAYGRPSIALFGPTPPTLWGPPRNPCHRVLWAGIAGDPHAGAPDPGLLQIAPRDVLVVADELLGSPAVPSTTRPRPHRTAGKFSDGPHAEER